MITVAILINGQPIMARSATNTGEQVDKGRMVYRVDTGELIYHNPEDGAVALAMMLLKTIKEG